MKKVIVRVKLKQADGHPFTLRRWLENYAGRLVTLDVISSRRKKVYVNKLGLNIPSSEFRIVTPAKTIAEVFKDVETELVLARLKHPSNRFMMAALTEEAGESAQAMIDHSLGSDSVEHIYKELIQTMTVALRLILEGSQEFTFQGMFPHDKSSIPAPKTDYILD